VEGTATVVFLQGESDVLTLPLLADTLSRVVACAAGDVIVDLAGAVFIDSATTRTLAVLRELLERQDRRLTLRSPSRMAIRVLDLFGLTELVGVPAG
jgi:anti-anti-sigma factor